MSVRRSAVVSLVACLALVAACGQKAGVHLASSSGGLGGSSAGTDASTGGSAAAAGDASSAATGTAGAAGSAGGASGSAAAAGTKGGAAAGSAGAAASAGGTSGGAADRTGVTDKTIVIGLHAPATGAGAPATSFNDGKQKYFDSIGATINGRSVTVEFQDDGYNPSQAVAACKSLVQEKHVFMLVGGGGTDQIVACAQYANSVGVPYVAEGVTEQGVSTLKTYFAESMTYKAQGALLAQYMKAKGYTKWAMIRGNTANFEDAHSSFVSAAGAAGLTKFSDDSVPKDADNQTMSSEAQKFCTPPSGKPDHSDVALYPLMSPKLFIAFAVAAAQQQCFPRYAGVGITLGLNVVAQALCPSGALKSGATFFSPYQGLDVADTVDPAYHKAYSGGDDIGFALWGAEKLIAAQLKAGGRDLSRQSFLQGVLSTKTFSTGVYPPVDYSASRFGGTAVHVLSADCANNRYGTESQNNKGF